MHKCGLSSCPVELHEDRARYTVFALEIGGLGKDGLICRHCATNARSIIARSSPRKRGSRSRAAWSRPRIAVISAKAGIQLVAWRWRCLRANAAIDDIVASHNRRHPRESGDPACCLALALPSRERGHRRHRRFPQSPSSPRKRGSSLLLGIGAAFARTRPSTTSSLPIWRQDTASRLLERFRILS